MIPPTAAVAATPEPVIAAKKTLDTTTARASPPVKCPTMDLAKATILRDIPPNSMSTPAMTKKGTAMRVNLSTLDMICCVMISGGVLAKKTM